MVLFAVPVTAVILLVPMPLVFVRTPDAGVPRAGVELKLIVPVPVIVVGDKTMLEFPAVRLTLPPPPMVEPFQ